MRGFYLADPEDLSLLVLVEQFASGDTPGDAQMFRIRGGNDRLATGIADALRGPILLDAIVQANRAGRESACASPSRRTVACSQLTADACVVTLPASTLRDVAFDPPLPDDQHRAIATLSYGRATRLLLQFDRRFWKHGRRPTAFGTDLPTGAVWDGNEQQRGPPASSRFLAGGRASAELQAILASEGEAGAIAQLALARHAGVAARLAHDRVGRRPVVARRLRLLRSARSIRGCAPGSRVPPVACCSPASTRASAGRAT